jgi:hypothetical protein
MLDTDSYKIIKPLLELEAVAGETMTTVNVLIEVALFLPGSPDAN